LLCLSAAQAELTPAQVGELQTRLDRLGDALAAGHSNETYRAAATLQRWVYQTDASLPVDLICERALTLAAREFDPNDREARQLSESIRRLSANLDSLQSASQADVSQARAVLAKVLSEAEYQSTIEPNWWQQIMMRLLRWMDRLMRLLHRIPGAERVASVMFYVAVALLLLPLLAVIGYLVWWQFKQRRDAPHIAMATTTMRLESPDAHLARAEECVRQGQYVEALKQFHLAVLAALEQRGWVAHDRTRTNWEYLAQLEAKPAPPESASLLRSLNRLYDHAVFGTQPCDESLALEFGKTSQQLMQTVAAGSPRA